MKRPELKSCVITSNPANAKESITVVLGVEDGELVFGSDEKYMRTSGYEVYAGEEGFI